MNFQFRNIMRAASLALVLGVTSLAAAPAQAQSQPSFNFGFQTNDGFGFSFGNGTPPRAQHPRGHDRDWGHGGRDRQPIRHCLDNRAVRALVQNAGYRDVRPYSDDGRTVRVRAKRHRQSYIVTVNPCRARIVDEVRIRR